MQQFESNNYAALCGTVSAAPELSHRSRGEAFYRFPLCVERLSGTEDCLNVLVRERLLAETPLQAGERVTVEGEIRSFNNRSGIGARLVLTVFARAVSPESAARDSNLVRLTGTLCKPPVLRVTPRGRQICDLMVAVNRRCARSDYLPCIAWGEQAERAGAWDVGDVVSLEGRFQSRGYVKQTDAGPETRTAYEISVSEIALT